MSEREGWPFKVDTEGDRVFTKNDAKVLMQKATGTGDTVVAGNEVVVKPKHYTQFAIEPITFIMQNRLSFETGSIVKYALRAGSKLYEGKTADESAIIDLEKVRRYAEMRINQIKGQSTL